MSTTEVSIERHQGYESVPVSMTPEPHAAMRELFSFFVLVAGGAERFQPIPVPVVLTLAL